jgi:hypothetical protein
MEGWEPRQHPTNITEDEKVQANIDNQQLEQFFQVSQE